MPLIYIIIPILILGIIMIIYYIAIKPQREGIHKKERILINEKYQKLYVIYFLIYIIGNALIMIFITGPFSGVQYLPLWLGTIIVLSPFLVLINIVSIIAVLLDKEVNGKIQMIFKNLGYSFIWLIAIVIASEILLRPLSLILDQFGTSGHISE